MFTEGATQILEIKKEKLDLQNGALLQFIIAKEGVWKISPSRLNSNGILCMNENHFLVSHFSTSGIIHTLQQFKSNLTQTFDSLYARNIVLT